MIRRPGFGRSAGLADTKQHLVVSCSSLGPPVSARTTAKRHVPHYGLTSH